MSSHLYFPWHHCVTWSRWWWEYLHHRNWHALHIREPCIPDRWLLNIYQHMTSFSWVQGLTFHWENLWWRIFFCPPPRQVDIRKPGIETKPQQWQHWMFNSLSQERTPSLYILDDDCPFKPLFSSLVCKIYKSTGLVLLICYYQQLTRCLALIMVIA